MRQAPSASHGESLSTLLELTMRTYAVSGLTDTKISPATPAEGHSTPRLKSWPHINAASFRLLLKSRSISDIFSSSGNTMNTAIDVQNGVCPWLDSCSLDAVIRPIFSGSKPKGVKSASLCQGKSQSNNLSVRQRLLCSRVKASTRDV